ncbi:MAG TPA: alpha-glucan family phosphorylase [Bacteroidales bacterium]|nr:alpha-glucan family phosphorylase [Bacteroidales bacterium]HOL98147.1 alpha-glucan family phosphorylase [Bacteroidales bacterium]HOM36504.1 alpha-glucan family phosphorylase [Bacteroidales bacterium]HPD23956.1 alpha-glucan family phosphorylase [Bacteroidales bacterium]HRS99936.1 alpha-glucan family phosphorylase [Bacteroidales bacterium]
MEKKYLKPDYIFEVSWEVCNKVGGIHTVLSTKSISLSENCGKLVLIGPDVWRDNEEHPEFDEDNSLFSDWKRKLDYEQLRVRIGYWKIPGRPIALLVDFSNYINQKDQIFYEFWEKYKLDSLSGQWDYIEPALFGYASGKVIESFVRFYSSIHDKIIAHFHEWMTGTGILYLKNEMPQIATAFTTHATVIGRCVAGNGMPLYKNLDKLNGDLLSVEFNIISKQSLEKISAQNADVFTTVSEITAQECIQFLGKNVDKVTPNGFEDNFIPADEEYKNKRAHARRLFISVAEALTDYKFDREPIILATSGRYEFYNKGYDLFIDSLGKMNKNKNIKKEVLAYILVPANHYGPIKNLYNKINTIVGDQFIQNKYLTHNLHDPEYDPILRRLAENELFNSPDDKVKVVFVPSYLNGDDGIFNTKYYDLLPGLDLTAFVSYYEPWGYTPLESTAFGIPTITTSLAGFGKWMKNYSETEKCVKVIERTDENFDFVITEIVNFVENFSRLTDEDIEALRKCAKNAASKALWKNLIFEYLEAYSIAFKKIKERHDIILQKPVIRKITETAVSEVQEPVWRKIEVQTTLPEKFKCLDNFALNLWWSWNPKAAKMFKYISPELWKKSEYNPVVFLDSISSERLSELENDTCFLKMYDEVCNDFKAYMKEAENKKPPKIAYFSMEFGLIDCVKIFSGGLGILAGDYLKEASDSNIDMVGIGLLYRYGYFKQKLTSYGDQQAEYIPQNFDKMPILPVRDENGAQLKTSVNFPGRSVYAKIWEVNVGRVKLYLLDTDTEDNQEQDRYITSQLYGGDSEMRFKQEMILGVAGVRALHELKIYPDVYHCNEGHAAFIGLERLRLLRTKRNLKFDEALEIIRASTLFTTHTPVPAGHDAFDENLMRVYMSHYPERLKITWEEMMKLGKLKPEEKFSMSYLASNVSQEINGVSKLHGEVSKKMFVDLWPGYFAMENHVGYVTNGVHFKTWAAKEWQELYINTFGTEFLKDLSNPEHWRKIHDVDDVVIWKLRQHFRKKLVNYVKEKAKQNIIRRYDDPKYLVDIQEKINENVLTIGFARRFATYKRGDLLLRNPDRLARILNNKEMPVQILFAGKAHPNDVAGQKLIKRIVELSKMPAFLGKIIFIEDYDINLAKKLVQGVDIWLNTPTRPMEASGTSGMKAVMNGVLHFSVLDGWWVEGYRENAGWALPAERTYQNQDFQNELDAQVIFSLLENEIVPLFYNRDENGIPHEWVKFIKNSIAEIAPQFTTKRMIDDYIKRYYSKLYSRSLEMKKNDYEMAVRIAEWKRNVRRIWDDVKVISARFPDYETQPMNLNENFYGEVTLDLSMLSPDDVGVEVVITDSTDKINANILAKYPGNLVEINNKVARYEIVGSTKKPGFYNYAVRIFAKNDLLPYPQDSGLVKWV